MTGAAHDFRAKAQDENELLCPELGGTSTVSTKLCVLAPAAISSVLVEKQFPSKEIVPNLLPAAGQTGLNACKRVRLPLMAIHPRTLMDTGTPQPPQAFGTPFICATQ